MTRVFVVRHGETDWNREGRLQGSSDVPLNDAGRAQARAAAGSLWAELDRSPLAATFVSSTLCRAVETARLIIAGRGGGRDGGRDGGGGVAPLHQDSRLSERKYGLWEGLTVPQRAADFPDDHERWRAGLEPDFAGYESHAVLAARVGAATSEWVARVDGDLVLVSHGSAARMLILAMLGLPLTGRLVGNLENAAWSRLVPAGAGGWELDRHNVGAGPVAP